MACSGNCDQGRGCLGSTNASRAALGLPPLRQAEGGMHVNCGISFPIKPRPTSECEKAGRCKGDERCHDQLCASHPFMQGVPSGYPADEPLYTPETVAEPLPGMAQAIAGFIALIALAISAFALPALLSH